METACEKATDEAATEQEDEAKGRAKEDKVGNRHVRGPIESVFRFSWDAIRTWIIQPKPDRGVSRGEEDPKADQRRTGPDED